MKLSVKKYNKSLTGDADELSFNFVECLSKDVVGVCHDEAKRNLRAGFETVSRKPFRPSKELFVPKSHFLAS